MNFSWILDSVIARVPAAGPDRIAFSFDGRDRITYGELHDKTLRYARALRELGLRKGDRLGLLLFNDAEYPPLFLAAARLGVITVRLNFRLAPAELAFVLADSGTSVVVVHSSLTGRLDPVRDQAGVGTYVVLPDSGDPVPDWARPFEVFREAEPLTPDELPEVTGDDPMSLLYTSGTTGSPKGAVWTHGNTVAIATAQALRWQFGEETVSLVPGPLYHAGGFEAFVAPALLMHGTAVFLPSGNFTVDRLLAVLRAERVTDCLLFPFMLNELLHRDDLERVLPPSLRRFILGGDMVMPSVAEEVKRRLPEVKLTQVYGLTEGGAIATTLEDRDFLAQPKSIGRPLPLAQARVVTPEGREAAAGEVGEIEVRSPAVSQGYWNRPDATRATFHDGWCRTGDLGYVNADGFLHLSGRAKDMIRSGGENIYPAEVEKVLAAHPQVLETAVVAVPDSRYGEVGCAIVVPEAGQLPEPDALRAFCRERLAGYKVPKYFLISDELPRNASGKILKYRLREAFAHIESELNGEKTPT
ncbi:long-chain-fatty-acid--CoA ligase [Amycolatopsis deserti]|uniref:Long-chain-fatty-acid--CoA ligase n=1 Tax=Amycolatopsis deserti TaxID=185696 RepID=A0ABQ3IT91_9PSEU|nr:class I adenylate-forming enzyme family protein [Amycolatopsis deserti]GHE93955.1 long-chain-fatty-acid--CoA ligase [Amycolatopsis deserti]